VVNLRDPGFLQTSMQASAQGLLIIIIQVQCPMPQWVWLQFELVCDDPRNTYAVLMIPPPLSHCCLDGKDQWESWKILWRCPPWMWR